VSEDNAGWNEPYPKTVYVAPFRVNFVPDVFTNPVDAGAEAVEVGALLDVVPPPLPPGLQHLVNTYRR
jgi:hypothetical protein